jgi:hypothetical protein
MPFLETAAMNRQFREAEAVLLAGGWHPPSPRGLTTTEPR